MISPKFVKSALLIVVATAMHLHQAHAGPVTQTSVDTFSAYDKGVMEIEATVGHFWSVGNPGTDRRPEFAYGFGSLRAGWMLSDPSGPGILRGNCEFLVGFFGGLIYEGPGDYLVGGDLNLRYNFVQPSAKIVPFFQIGAGGAYSDAANEDQFQNLIGSEWSWELQSALGFRVMLTERMAFTAMCEYQHLSNAGSNDRNRGWNGIGGLVGLSWFY